MATSGKLIAIATRLKSRAPMVEIDAAEITAAAGVVGDFRGKPGKRQVTVMSAADWARACEALGQDLPWTTRRANLLVDDLPICDTAGATLQIGDVTLQVTGETDPCERMEEAAPGLRVALTPEWRGGVCCRVLTGGAIRVGDAVTINAVTQTTRISTQR
jgi:MOSC domain-containing protein YiiM